MLVSEFLEVGDKLYELGAFDARIDNDGFPVGDKAL